jgi:hypothetical protein
MKANEVPTEKILAFEKETGYACIRKDHFEERLADLLRMRGYVVYKKSQKAAAR